MRVIGGEFRSRRLKSIPGLATRPTPDRLRETLFNILAPQIEGAVFVDAYAGSGAVGIEALSRGAVRSIFLEKNRAATAVIHANLASLGIENRALVANGPAAALLRHYTADIVFLDPPYELEREYAACFESLSAAPPALVVAQHSTRLALSESYGPLRRTRLLKQGDNGLTFFAPEQRNPETGQ